MLRRLAVMKNFFFTRYYLFLFSCVDIFFMFLELGSWAICLVVSGSCTHIFQRCFDFVLVWMSERWGCRTGRVPVLAGLCGKLFFITRFTR